MNDHATCSHFAVRDASFGEGRVIRRDTIYRHTSEIILIAHDVTVLLRGETGTGKELVGRAIHAESHRREHPFIPLDCTTLPEILVESEIFGYEKGAFTGAVERKPGRFERAQQGTLFLDEICNLSLQVQMKLLRVLQEGEVERLRDKEGVRIDVRLVAAANAENQHDKPWLNPVLVLFGRSPQ